SAKLCLLAPAKKAEYDEQLRAAKQAAEGAARPQSRAVRSTGKSRPVAAADPSMPFDEAEDIVSVGHDSVITPVFGVTTAPTLSSAPAADGNKRWMLIGAGVVAVACVGALLFVALRGGNGQIVSGSGNTIPIEPNTTVPAHKSPIEGSSNHAIGKTPPI